jgi:acetolactate synthase-1/3 small subunit
MTDKSEPIPASAYDMSTVESEVETRTLAVIVDNEPGVLGRVVGLFSARGYNIESLTVAEVDRRRHRSRITIVTNGTPQMLEQIEAQLLRLVPVASVTDMTKSKRGVERELALIKVAGKGDNRVEALRVAEVFRAKVVDTTTSSFIFELTGTPDKIDSFIAIMRELGVVEVGRTGIVGMIRGAEAA